MSQIYKGNIELEMFGCSHDDYIGVIVHNFPKGYKINYELINKNLAHRRPKFIFNTPRVEEDEYFFSSGVKENVTTGLDLTIMVKNKNIDSSSYKKGNIRANHADYPAYIKYQDKFDFRGGGQFSGRLTTPLVILGAMCLDLLKERNIYIGSRIKKALDIEDDELGNDLLNNIFQFNDDFFPMINENKRQQLIEKLTSIENDSVGGEIESYIVNLPIGLGEPYFGSLEAKISYSLFAIPSVKGVLFGDGIKFTNSLGSKVLDKLEYVDDKVVIKTNHMGGINGGLSNGNPVVVQTIFRPISSINQSYESINVFDKKNIILEPKGRHDKFILNRCCVIVDSLLAITILDILLGDLK